MAEKPGTGAGPEGPQHPGSPDIFRELDSQLGEARGQSASVQDLKRSYSIVETLLNVSTSLNSTLNLEQLLEKIVDAVVDITGCKRGYLMLAEKKGGLSVAVARAREGKPTAHKSFDVSLSVIKKAASSGQPQLVSDAREEDDLRDQRSIVDFDIRTVICIPLKFEGKLVGVIYADNDTISEKFTRSDLPVLNAFGAQAAVAIENARSRGELEKIKRSLEKQNLSLRQQLVEKYEFSGIVGRGPAMQKVFGVITKVAPLSTTVLIQGETGTGKELIAKAIHYNSERKSRAMVSVNCGALPKNILESELFGYRKGAFTGADEDRSGLFEAADNGTLFLDEIGDMPVELQVKLLRALQDGEVKRLGEERTIRVNVRVIAATNRDLAAEVQGGNFRNDLFYRLNVIPIFLPPLRDRQEDILPLADFFLDKHSKKMKKTKPVLTRPAREMLLTHSWVGNVRELENAIERALALAEGADTVDVDQFEHLIDRKSAAAFPDVEAPLKAMALIWEKQFLKKMLVRNSWNVSKTANVLKISRQQLHNKIKKHGLRPEI
ncbi:MAG: sigma 54-interacting transcriptional regulator [Candidatus Krumholzibacteria bacterium]|nr:sigma 54-interacting transcriptional regulator [Candidatus Krumholzibacteria bacterium]